MPCQDNVSTTQPTYEVTHETTTQVEVAEAPIPIKIGEPLSTQCDRATRIGSIPDVVKHPAFTTIDGGVKAVETSNGGVKPSVIVNFFTNQSGCYQNANARLASTCC